MIRVVHAKDEMVVNATPGAHLKAFLANLKFNSIGVVIYANTLESEGWQLVNVFPVDLGIADRELWFRKNEPIHKKE